MNSESCQFPLWHIQLIDRVCLWRIIKELKMWVNDYFFLAPSFTTHHSLFITLQLSFKRKKMKLDLRGNPITLRIRIL
jgi:hypothetical protein